MFFQSFLYTSVPGFGEFFPTNWNTVMPARAPGFIQPLKSRPEIPNPAAPPPTAAAARPLGEKGTPNHSYRNPRLSVRFLLVLKSSLAKISNSRCWIVLRIKLEVRKSANVVSVGLFRKYSLLIDEIEPARKFKRFWAFVALLVPRVDRAGLVLAIAVGPVTWR